MKEGDKSSKTSSYKDLFEQLALPNEEGFSRKVSIEEFTEPYSVLQLGNGGSWCRDDGPLGKIYNIVRHKKKGKITHIELHGYKKGPIDKNIPPDISKKIKKLKCVVLRTVIIKMDTMMIHDSGISILKKPRTFNLYPKEPLWPNANIVNDVEKQVSVLMQRAWDISSRNGVEIKNITVHALDVIGMIRFDSIEK